MDVTAPPGWQDTARVELRRSRQWLLSVAEGLSESDLEWFAPRAEATCAKWHLGRVGLAERRRLAGLVEGLRPVPSALEPFARPLPRRHATTLPTWPEVRRELEEARKLTLALLPHVDGAAAAEAVRDIVNAEYAEARFARRIRLELGRPDVAEPRGRLVGLDTDVEAPPLFLVASWTPPSRRKKHVADVVCLKERRSERAEAALVRGHQLVTTGDLRAALRAFEDAAAQVESADALTYQGWMHALLGDLERAESLCLRAIRLDPDFGNPYNDIGTIRLQRRDVSSAIQWFERAKEAQRYEPRHFPFVNLGRLYVSLGLTEKALREFEGALVHAPGNEEVRAAVEQLRAQVREREA